MTMETKHWKAAAAAIMQRDVPRWYACIRRLSLLCAIPGIAWPTKYPLSGAFVATHCVKVDMAIINSWYRVWDHGVVAITGHAHEVWALSGQAAGFLKAFHDTIVQFCTIQIRGSEEWKVNQTLTFMKPLNPTKVETHMSECVCACVCELITLRACTLMHHNTQHHTWQHKDHFLRKKRSEQVKQSEWVFKLVSN